MAFKMNGFSAFTKKIDPEQIKKLSGEMNVSENVIKQVIKKYSDESQDYDDFTYEDVKNAVIDEVTGWDKDSD
tara:strand:+ start:1713 stop:1931 length:219 start_codon:yes stop_codon:yes gene_type:complete